MCRLVVFVGSCTRCAESHTWEDLTQHLSCLEAKNNGSFGECEAGIFSEQHDFDQECDRCSEEDEGIGDVGFEDMHFADFCMSTTTTTTTTTTTSSSSSSTAAKTAMPSAKRAAAASPDSSPSGRKKQKT